MTKLMAGKMPQLKNGTLSLEGYGLRVAVERRHLVVADGICDERRTGRFAKATAGLKRLVVLGHTGFVTLEALRFLRDADAAFLHIDTDGQVIVASGPAGLDDARLRRAQALALSNGIAMKVARELLRRKLQGQLCLLTRLDNHQPGLVIRASLDKLEAATTQAQLRRLEAEGAAEYWQAWEHIPVRFVRRDEPRVPDHWRTFGIRGSPFANGPRLAANPANAILNYLYAILEGEARLSALKMGLDPGMGVLHADEPGRDSLALDLIEPLRPEVDGFVLDLLHKQAFRADDFFETRQGGCRIQSPLTHILAETAPRWATRVGPVTERVAYVLMSSRRRVRGFPTLLTQANRIAGRDRLRRRPRKQAKTPHAGLSVCLECGTVLEDRKRRYCDDCLPGHRAEVAEEFRKAGAVAIKNHIAHGSDPAHGGMAGKKRGQTVSQHNYAVSRWDVAHTEQADPETFRSEVLPRLAGVPLRRLMQATGLSLRYCSLIRRGLKVPHPRHWAALASAPRDDTVHSKTEFLTS